VTEITKSEFEEWQNHFITKAFLSAVYERIEECKDVLAGSAGIDAVQDNLIRGMIHAFREVMLFRVEDQSEETE
jgi:hypothetical protein